MLVLILFLSIATSLMIFNISNAKASIKTDLDPDPDEPGFEDSYWNFSEGDVFGWEVKYYVNDDILINVEPYIFNVSSLKNN